MLEFGKIHGLICPSNREGPSGAEEQQEEIDAIQWNVEEFIQRLKNDESIVFGGKGFITEVTPDDEIELAIEAALASNETYKYGFCVESDGSIVPTTNI
ncbi:hypothetical protein ACOME3_002316 [Neoechinorhynchus agilis]